MSPPADLEALFLSELPLIERVISSICRRNCCYGDEAEDFAAEVKLKLIENDYRVLERFQGRSSLSTYLTTVIHNLFRDYRIAKWGKWRPSAAARRMGDVAVQLETLISRDRLGSEEAIQMLVTNRGVSESPQELAAMVEKLPSRPPRTRENTEVLEHVPGEEGADRLLEEVERTKALEKTSQVLNEAIGLLEPDERLLLRLRIDDGISVTDIAKSLRLERRRLFTRFDRMYRQLRRSMEERGVSGEVVGDLLGWEGSDLAIDYGPAGKGPEASV